MVHSAKERRVLVICVCSLWTLFILAQSVCAVTNVQHKLQGNVLMLSYEGTPPFSINIRRDTDGGQAGGYVWSTTFTPTFTQDMSFAYNPDKKFYYWVKDARGAATGQFTLGGEENLCQNYYGGRPFDGFCITDERTILGDPHTEGGQLRYTPDGSNVERIIKYPLSVEVVNFGINTQINITLHNEGQTTERVRINGVRIGVYNDESINFDQEYIVGPQETKEVSIPIDLPQTPTRTARQRVNVLSVLYDNGEAKLLPRTIFYWRYDPFAETEVAVLECGGRAYNKNQGVCNNDMLFPAIEGFACQTDSECEDNPNTAGTQCFENTCLSMTGSSNLGPRNKKYDITILPVYVTEDDEQYTTMKLAVENHITAIIPKMDYWFNTEKIFWNEMSEFELHFSKSTDSCRFTLEEFQQISPGQQNMGETALREIERRCVTHHDYDILLLSIQREENFPNVAASGINYGSIIASSLSPRTMLHEILHSFGEHDLYGVESYQWGNCYLYNAYSSNEDWDQRTPHLCKFEAMQLGWYPKWPN